MAAPKQAEENTKLESLKVGSLTLSPSFDSDVYEYTAQTSNNSNTVTAVPCDPEANVVLELNGAVLDTNSARWTLGENTLTVRVILRGRETTYTVKVTK